MHHSIFKTVVAGFVLLLFSCTYRKGEDVTPDKSCKKILPDTISFSRHILPIFAANCNGSGCHSGGAPAGNLNLDSVHAYTQLMKKGSGYVDTISPEQSVLYTQLISVSQPMPPNGRMDECNIQMILKWMEQKAKNN